MKDSFIDKGGRNAEPPENTTSPPPPPQKPGASVERLKLTHEEVSGFLEDSSKTVRDLAADWLALTARIRDRKRIWLQRLEDADRRYDRLREENLRLKGAIQLVKEMPDA